MLARVSKLLRNAFKAPACQMLKRETCSLNPSTIHMVAKLSSSAKNLKQAPYLPLVRPLVLKRLLRCYTKLCGRFLHPALVLKTTQIADFSKATA